MNDFQALVLPRVMMRYTEGLADVVDGQIEYLDSGAPSTQDYQTFLLIPGADTLLVLRPNRQGK